MCGRCLWCCATSRRTLISNKEPTHRLPERRRANRRNECTGPEHVDIKKAVEGERKWAKFLWTWGCRWTGSLLGRMPDPTTIWATEDPEYTGGSTTSKPGASSRASEAERPTRTMRW